MPIYEYRCSACQHKLESLQKLSDPRLTTCPVCGKEALTKLVSAAGFHLKGSGWYATDFKNSGSKPATKEKSEKSEGAEASKPEGGDKSSDAKPASGDAAPAAKSDSPATPPASSTASATATPAARSPAD